MLTEEKRREISERMRQNNPMHNPKTRKRVSRTLKKKGWKPTVRGGNGTGPTAAQKILSDFLKLETEIVVVTGKPKGSGYPPAYKLDLGEEELKIGIEIDGKSHRLLRRQKQDAKKEALLKSLGWTVLRFTNQQVMEHLAACAQAVVSTMWRSTATTTTSRKAS